MNSRSTNNSLIEAALRDKSELSTKEIIRILADVTGAEEITNKLIPNSNPNPRLYLDVIDADADPNPHLDLDADADPNPHLSP